jgi:hypothetical protein
MKHRHLLDDTVEKWAGLLGGTVAWYAAHEASFYALRMSNCAAIAWVVAAIHAAALLVTLTAGGLSFRAARSGDGKVAPSFAAAIGLGAAAIFTVVIIWQGAAAFVYSGCEQ